MKTLISIIFLSILTTLIIYEIIQFFFWLFTTVIYFSFFFFHSKNRQSITRFSKAKEDFLNFCKQHIKLEVQYEKIRTNPLNAHCTNNSIQMNKLYFLWFSCESSNINCQNTIKQTLYHEVGHWNHKMYRINKDTICKLNPICRLICFKICRQIDEVHSDLFSVIYGLQNDKEIFCKSTTIKELVSNGQLRFLTHYCSSEYIIEKQSQEVRHCVFTHRLLAKFHHRHKPVFHPTWKKRREYVRKYTTTMSKELIFDIIEDNTTPKNSKEIAHVFEFVAGDIVSFYNDIDLKNKELLL